MQQKIDEHREECGVEQQWAGESLKSLWFICTHVVRYLAAEIAMNWIHSHKKGLSHQFSQFFEANPQESFIVKQQLENALDSQLKQLEEKDFH